MERRSASDGKMIAPHRWDGSRRLHGPGSINRRSELLPLSKLAFCLADARTSFVRRPQQTTRLALHMVGGLLVAWAAMGLKTSGLASSRPPAVLFNHL